MIVFEKGFSRATLNLLSQFTKVDFIPVITHIFKDRFFGEILAIASYTVDKNSVEKYNEIAVRIIKYAITREPLAGNCNWFRLSQRGMSHIPVLYLRLQQILMAL